MSHLLLHRRLHSYPPEALSAHGLGGAANERDPVVARLPYVLSAASSGLQMRHAVVGPPV